jgi:hypothetical protein
MVKRACVAVAVAAAVAGSASGFSRYQGTVPNTAVFNFLGHTGGNTRNVDPFGKDFANQGHKWTVALCQMDSDGDGVSNGAEVGDPDCQWTRGNDGVLKSTSKASLSDPGNKASRITVAPPATPAVPGTVPAPAPAPAPAPGQATDSANNAGSNNAGSNAAAAGATTAGATSGGGPSPAVIGAGAGVAALVGLAVLSQKSKRDAAARAARLAGGNVVGAHPYPAQAPQHVGSRMQTAMPWEARPYGKPGAGEEVIV